MEAALLLVATALLKALKDKVHDGKDCVPSHRHELQGSGSSLGWNHAIRYHKHSENSNPVFG